MLKFALTCSLAFALFMATPTKGQAVRTELVTVAVFTMPADTSLKNDFYPGGDAFSFVPGSTVDFLGAAGVMPVLIAFDLPAEKRDFLLSRCDALLVASPDSDLQGASGLSSYSDTIKSALHHAEIRRQAGDFFPILALGNGMDLLLGLSATSPSTLKCHPHTDNRTQAMTIDLTAAGRLPFTEWANFLRRRTSTLAAGNLHFDNRCSVSAADFAQDSGLKQAFEVLATDSSGQSIEVVAHRRFPITGFHFHPETHLFERGEPHAHLDRSEATAELAKDLILTFAQSVRDRGRPKTAKAISSQLKQYFASFRPADLPLADRWERIYTYQLFDGF